MHARHQIARTHDFSELSPSCFPIFSASPGHEFIYVCPDIRTYTLTSYVYVWMRSHTSLRTGVCVRICMGMHMHLHVAHSHSHSLSLTHTHTQTQPSHTRTYTTHKNQEHTSRSRGPLRSCLYMYHSSRYPRKQSLAGLFEVARNWCRHPAHVI
jgi:hypothetical protein